MSSASAAPQQTAEAAACTHCGLPVPARERQPGADEQFCCAGCRTVHAALRDHGLDRWYALAGEAGAAAEPARTTGADYAELDHEEVQARAVRHVGGVAHAALVLEGVRCAACVWLIERMPSVVDGLLEARLDLGRARVELRWDPERTSLARIARALDRFGYPAHPAGPREEEERRRSEDRRALMRIGVAGALAANAMGIAFALYGGALSGMDPAFRDFFRWISAGLAALALAWPGRTFFRGAWGALRTRTPHMDLPVAIGLSAGFSGGLWNTVRGGGEVYFESVTVLVLLLLVGRHLQRRQQRRAWDAVALTSALTPSRARRRRGDALEEVPVSALVPGDRVVLRAGETVPADARIVDGASTFDRAVLTGESVPVALGAGEVVHAGTVNCAATVELVVERTGAETRVGRLIELVERAARGKAPVVQLADRMAGWFTAVVLVCAAATAWAWRAHPEMALEAAVALLIVACPCALGLATPLAIAAALGRAARDGILVKGGAALERLARPGVLLLDKTGTLTRGVCEVAQWDGDARAGRLAAALQAHATHPYAAAFRRRFAGEDEGAADPIDVTVTVGGGVRGRVDGAAVLVGSPAFARRHGCAVPEARLDPVLAAGRSPVVVAVDGRLAGVAGMGDAPAPDARDQLQRLRARGWDLRVLSGDHPRAVAATARALGLDPEQARGGLSPEDKVAAVEAVVAEDPARTVVMVGDGWNDAAALARAPVGIAVHGGAEASLAAADVYLARPGLGGVVRLTEGARRTARVIRRNLAVSLAYNATGVALAAAGWVHPIVAAVLMPTSSLTVVALAYHGIWPRAERDADEVARRPRAASPPAAEGAVAA